MFLTKLAGPKILFIDDVRTDVSPIVDKLEEKKLSSLFVDASPESEKPKEPIQSAELVFLDLYYGGQGMSQFDPELCADLIQKTVPKEKQYYLVVFSRDTDRAFQVLQILKEIDLVPVKTLIKQKTDYDFKQDEEVERLLSEVDHEFEQIQHVEQCYAEIVSIEDNEVIVDCLLDAQDKIYQTRHLDLFPLSNMEIVPGKYIVIRTIVKLGGVAFEFYPHFEDLSELFSKENYFKNIDPNELYS